MARFPRIPDLLTTANLACGVGSILLASQGQLTWACWLVFAGALFDVFDGLAARALGGGTPLGAQLDSLADMVTFGVAPGMLLFSLPFMNGTAALLEGGSFYMSDVYLTGELTEAGLSPHPPHHPFIWAAAVLIPICSAWRLAKFNLDTRQTSGFLGLPTPANALFWASYSLAASASVLPDATAGTGSTVILFLAGMNDPSVILVSALLLGILMLSELPLPSLKFKHFRWKGNEVMFLLLSIGVVLVLLYGVLAVPMILVLYLLSPLWGRLFPKIV